MTSFTVSLIRNTKCRSMRFFFKNCCKKKLFLLDEIYTIYFLYFITVQKNKMGFFIYGSIDSQIFYAFNKSSITLNALYNEKYFFSINLTVDCGLTHWRSWSWCPGLTPPRSRAGRRGGRPRYTWRRARSAPWPPSSLHGHSWVIEPHQKINKIGIA